MRERQNNPETNWHGSRRLKAVFFHFGSPDFAVVSVPPVAESEARWHRRGDPPNWYGTDRLGALWRELDRSLPAEIDRAHVLLRVGRVAVDAIVLDLTDPTCRGEFGVELADLVSDECSQTHRIAGLAMRAGFDGLIAPSAAHPEATTLVIFNGRLECLRLLEETICTPPGF